MILRRCGPDLTLEWGEAAGGERRGAELRWGGWRIDAHRIGDRADEGRSVRDVSGYWLGNLGK